MGTINIYNGTITINMTDQDNLIIEDGDVMQDNEEVLYDTHYYANGHNDYTVEESVEAAMQRLWEQIVPPEVQDSNDEQWDDIEKAVTKMIRNGEGRQAVYALAGGIAKGYKEGKYEGVPFSWVFKGFVEGKIEHEEPRSVVGGSSLGWKATSDSSLLNYGASKLKAYGSGRSVR